MPPVLTNLSCTLLPGKYSNGDTVPDLYNNVYRFWRRSWSAVLNKPENASALKAENFLRQDVILVLHLGNRVVGITAATFFNLGAEPVYDHAYIAPFPEDLVKKLRQIGKGMITTGEYLFVDPEFRKSLVGTSLSEVLIGLNLRLFASTGSEVTLATPIRQAKVQESAAKFGYVEVGSYEKSGVECVMMFNTLERLRRHDDPTISNLIDDYWSRRRDLVGVTGADVIRIPAKRAA